MLTNVSNSDRRGLVGDADYKNLLNLEPGLVYPSTDGSFSVSIQFVLEGGLAITIPSSELGTFPLGRETAAET